MWNFLKKIFGKSESQPVVAEPVQSTPTPAPAPEPTPAPPVLEIPVVEPIAVPVITVAEPVVAEKPKAKRKKKVAAPVAETPWPFEQPAAPVKKKKARTKTPKA